VSQLKDKVDTRAKRYKVAMIKFRLEISSSPLSGKSEIASYQGQQGEQFA